MTARIVVGVGGLESVPAVQWALAEAQERHAQLEAVHVPAAHEDRTDLPDLLAYALGEAAESVTIVQTTGEAADLLIQRSAGATLLVLGTHQRGRLGRLLHGSVVQHCIEHAACPVVVVPTPAWVRSEQLVPQPHTGRSSAVWAEEREW